MSVSIPIFAYHYFSHERSTQIGINAEDLAFITLKETFEKHLQFLTDNNFTTISMATMAEGLREPSKLPAKPVVLTIDDGHSSVLDIAFPLLQQYGCKADIFAITDWIGKSGYLDWKQLTEMTDAGIGVQSHGKTHRLLNKLTLAERETELVESRKIIEDSLSQPVTAFAVAMGGYPRRLEKQVASAGYPLCLTSYHGTNSVASNPYTLRRIMIKYPYDSLSGLTQLMKPVSIPSASRYMRGLYKYIRNWSG